MQERNIASLIEECGSGGKNVRGVNYRRLLLLLNEYLWNYGMGRNGRTLIAT